MSGQVHTEQASVDGEGQPVRSVPRRTIEQRRAEAAARAVSSVSKDQAEAYAKFIRKVPSMLTTQGLGQTVAYLRSKQDQRTAKDALKHLRKWLTSSDGLIGWPEGDDDAFQAQIAQCDNASYYLALGEAITYVGWLKRLSQARLLELQNKVPGAGSDQSSQSTGQEIPANAKGTTNAG